MDEHARCLLTGLGAITSRKGHSALLTNSPCPHHANSRHACAHKHSLPASTQPQLHVHTHVLLPMPHSEHALHVIAASLAARTPCGLAGTHSHLAAAFMRDHVRPVPQLLRLRQQHFIHAEPPRSSAPPETPARAVQLPPPGMVAMAPAPAMLAATTPTCCGQAARTAPAAAAARQRRCRGAAWGLPPSPAPPAAPPAIAGIEAVAVAHAPRVPTPPAAATRVTSVAHAIPVSQAAPAAGAGAAGGGGCSVVTPALQWLAQVTGGVPNAVTCADAHVASVAFQTAVAG